MIQYTYIDYGTIDTACHTNTSTSKESSTSITGTIQGINNTMISINTTTSKNTFQGVHTSTICTSNTSTGISDTVISNPTGTVLIKVFIPVPNVPGIKVQVPIFAIFLDLVTVTNHNRMT